MAKPVSPVNFGSSRPPLNLPANEWRCLKCGKLLGVRRGGKLQVRLQGHHYLASLPVEATCRGCGIHNRT
jgi:RNase P subunit RPR2